MNRPGQSTFRLFRSESDRKISGVAGGLAEALEIDSTLVRLLWVLIVLVTSGVGLLAYLAMWAIVPPRSEVVVHAGAEPAQPDPAAESGQDRPAGPESDAPPAAGAGRRRSNAPFVAGLILIAIGVLFLADYWVSLRVWSYFADLIALALRLWPLILIAAGGLLVYSRLRR